MNRRPLGRVCAAAALLPAAAPAIAADLPAPAWDQEVGRRIEVRAEDLPEPYATDSVANAPRGVRRTAESQLRLPPGFHAKLFAEGITHARWLAVAPDGSVLVAQSNPGLIGRLTDKDGDGRADAYQVFAEGFDRPTGLAVIRGELWVADTEAVWRMPYVNTAQRRRVTADGALGAGSGHWTRTLAFDPKGGGFAVGIGSRGNVEEEDLPRASIQAFALDGTGQRTLASGLRNPVGIAHHPASGKLWVVVNERDGLGDGLVPDFLAEIAEGAFYGWPYGYAGANADPDYGHKRPDLVARTRTGEVLFLAHSAPLGLVFYDGAQFPAEMQGDAFVALHGSWNAGKPRGYILARIAFDAAGRPEGAGYEVFAAGFWQRGKNTAGVFGRPVGLAVAADGSLLVADDAGDAVWRISYRR